MQASAETPGEQSGRILDPCVIAVLFLVSAIPYVGTIGFYSDDWSFLQHFADAGISRVEELISLGVADPFRPRPGHGIYAAALFTAFGLDPLPYHLVNTVVLAASCGLLNAVLVAARLDRPSAFAAALIFTMLPQLSTVRVWYASFQISLSLLMFMASSFCEIRAARGGSLNWKVASLVFLTVNLSLYEIFAPLLIAVAIYAGWIRVNMRQPTTLFGRVTVVLPQTANVMFVVLALVGKSLVSTRSPHPAGLLDMVRYNVGVFFRPDYDWRKDYGLNLLAALDVNFRMLIPRAIDSAARAVDGGLIPLITSGLNAVFAFIYLMRMGGGLRSPKHGLLSTLAGFVVFWIGYATFLISGQTAISPSGIGNRTAVASALGVAIVIAGLVYAGSALLREAQLRRIVFSGMTSLFAFLFAMRIADLGSYWVQAYRSQQEVLRVARLDLAALPPGSTVILSGICPYTGPGIVFETSWDATGALRLTLMKRITGDVANSRTVLQEQGISTIIYDQAKFHPYGDQLFVYDPKRRRLDAITNRAEAERVIGGSAEQSPGCREAFVAHGVPI